MTHSHKVLAENIDYLVANYDQKPDFKKLHKESGGINFEDLSRYMKMRHYSEISGHDERNISSAISFESFVSLKIKTPEAPDYKGKGRRIIYGFYPTELGEIMVGQTEDGICYLGFLVDQNRDVALGKMKQHFRDAVFSENDGLICESSEQIMRIWHGNGDKAHPLSLDLHGTDLQTLVWKELLKIPVCQTVTYQYIAQKLGKPKASRAIGNAVGANPVSLLVPCHRVIRSTGLIDNYGWGSPRKKLLLGFETMIFGAEKRDFTIV
ncbi:MAG: hypothetical protein CO093_00965 [Alphaproteobacteria bacterium CG_4_9_14_3_um_filter_47_13]|nr:MAG: hypothetical protein CO093_00965 [Alphaproteobacteria bacterium CG_4_9_14_3_um_filter_47_13]